MNRKARQLTDYVPRYVSLYHVDYRDDLDEHEDIQEECIRSNSLEKLYEKAYEWYEEQESLNMRGYLEETRKSMEADSLAGQFEEHEDEIRDLIYDRNDSDPAKDLIRNSSVTNFFYSLGVEISGYQAGIPQRGESTAMACYKVRRALHLKKGQFDEKIEELVENAAYGGELRVYFNAMFDRLVSEDAENDFRSIRFYGNVVVAIADSLNGSGYHVRLPLDLTLPFRRDNLFVDSQVHYSYADEVCGMANDWCDSTKWETGMAPLTGSVRKSRMAEHQEQEAAYEKAFRSGKCTFGDMNYKRHRDVRYSNGYPAGCRCPHCGTFWID